MSRITEEDLRNYVERENLMAKKEKLPRTVAFTAREMIVELAKCEPGARVYITNVLRPVMTIEPGRDPGSGLIVVLGP